MKERGIIFAGESVRAILDGRKTQTRRVVKPNRNDGTFILMETMDGGWWPYRSRDGESCYPYGCEVPYSAPYGGEGSRLYVKEAWIGGYETGERGHWSCIKPTGVDKPDRVFYRATDDIDGAADEPKLSWKSSMFMPRWASRITLEVVAVRVERLCAITEKDALAEIGGVAERGYRGQMVRPGPIDAFEERWDSINRKRASWASNPWVWVVEFRRVT